MSDYNLNDLNLAGVRWEISDTPIMTPRAKSTPDVADTPKRQTAATIVAEIGRAAASVVPAVAPTQTMSIDTVRAMAARPNDMDTLKRMIGEFNHPLRVTATNTVLPHVGDGKLLIVTDMPSADDDESGNILSGATGELMDKMLNAIGESRKSVSIVPMVFWRTPGGRTPSQTELDMARPFVDKTIELIQPRVILTLGTLPATHIADVNLAKSHGVPVQMDNGATCVPIFHPNYLILKPAAKRDVWNALQIAQNILKSGE